MTRELRHRRPAFRAAVPSLLILALGAALAACDRTPPAPTTAVRLADQFKPVAKEGPAPTPLAAWSFKEAETPWQAGPGIAGLAIRDGLLQGKTTSAQSVLHLTRQPDAAAGDDVYAVEIRLRASAGANLYLRSFGQDEIDVAGLAAQPTEFAWRMSGMHSPLAGNEMRTYTLYPPSPLPAAQVRHLLLRPTDAEAADFAIESVRVIFRKEHFDSVAAGLAWQGLGEIYRETLVAHAPDTLKIPLTVPVRPRLELALGTLDEGALTFRVEIAKAGGTPEKILERQVASPGSWEPASVDLDAFAGQNVELSLSLAGGRQGAIGLWGSPTIYSRRPAAAKPDAKKPRGVILVITDTLRGDSLEVQGYGRPTGPAMAAFAKEGVRFSEAHSEVTWTKAAIPGILTSLFPNTHGVVGFDDRLPASATTLAEVYRQAGYATLSLSSVFFNGRMSNLHQGFEVVHEAASLPPGRASKTSKPYVERLLPWLEEKREVPFFVLLHLYDPHYPYMPQAPYDGMWADPSLTEQQQLQQQQVRAYIGDPLLRAVGMPSRSELQQAAVDPDAFIGQWRGWYDGSVRGMDEEIGRLLAFLDEKGMKDDVLVAMVSDHGEEFLDHDRTFHGQGLYNELTHVPMMLRLPGALPAGKVVDTPVQTIDLMPTLLELSGLETPKEAQGRSLTGLIRGDQERARPVFSVKPATAADALTPPPRALEAYSVIFEGWKLIHNVAGRDQRPEFELFQQKEDPQNRHDVAAQHPDQVQRLAGLLADWRKSVDAQRLAAADKAAVALSDEELERLRSLGYVQ